MHVNETKSAKSVFKKTEDVRKMCDVVDGLNDVLKGEVNCHNCDWQDG